MQIEYHVLDAEGAHPLALPVLRRLLQDGAQRPDDRFRVTVADPPVSGVLPPDDMKAFLKALDQNPEQALRLLAGLGDPDHEDRAPPEPEPVAAAQTGEAAAEEPSAGAGPAQDPAAAQAPAAPPLTGWRAWVAARPMLMTLAALLVLAALLFWPRDGSRPTGVDALEIVQNQDSEGETEAAPAAPAAPEVVEPRFVILETTAREGPDGTTAVVRELTRGERLQVVVAGGAEQAPEGWFRLSSGGYVAAEAVREMAPPPLARRLDREMTLQSQVNLYNGPSLAGPVQRTLALGQRIRIVGLVNDRVAEVRVGMDLGYAAYASLVAPEPTIATAPPSQTGIWPPPTIPAPASPPPTGEGLVLGAADLARAPSGDTMANYYPRRAFRDRIEAQVAIQCRVAGSGRLTDCHVWRETQQGYGFAEATIRMAQETFRAPRQTRDGRSTEGAQFRATITWRVS